MAKYQELAEFIMKGKVPETETYTKNLVEMGEPPLEIINEGLIAGMSVVGERFKVGDMFVPEVMMSARAMDTGLAIVKPLLGDTDMPSVGTVLIGTVKGDLHDIGKNLVAMIMESAGFKVINLGVDVSSEKFVEAVKTHKPNVLGMSAMLTTTMMQMKKVVELLNEEGLRDTVKVVIGGAPVTQKFASEIGADGYASDASSGADLCKALLV